MRILKYYEGLSEGIVESMERDPSIFMTGHAVDYPTGIFGSTVEARKRFGPKRVFDSPSMENAMAAIAIGAAAMGKRPILVHPRADFVFLAFDAMLNLGAKWHYMFGGNAGTVPFLVRAVVGKGWGQGATHSQSLQAPLAHFPGIKVAMPTTPADAKGLMLSALEASGPVVLLEHRSLYATEGEVPDEMAPIPFGQARVAREGTDVTIVATSIMAVEALTAAEEMERHGVSVEVIDPRSIRPLDKETIIRSVRKTGRLIVADTSWEMCGFASEVAALAAEQAFEDLKAPVRRIAPADCPAPVSHPLEDAFYPKASTLAKVIATMLDIETDTIGEIDPEDTFKGPY
jgi:pyruvate/2-oxoglutarate/acetoin dehydrogenase E1 component